MTTKAQQSGMQGVFLVAAELARLGFIVSPTSRSAKGADLLATDQQCINAYSVQVKTNCETFAYWLVGQHARQINSPSHIYVLVNLNNKTRESEFYVVPSSKVAEITKEEIHKNSVWYFVSRADVMEFKDAWHHFGQPKGKPDIVVP